MSLLDNYYDSLSQNQRYELERIRNIIRRIAPDVDESISYGVPTFKLNGRRLIYIAAYKTHISLYPASDDMVEAIGEELKNYRSSKGTLQYSSRKPISNDLIEKIIRFRLTSINVNS